MPEPSKVPNETPQSCNPHCKHAPTVVLVAPFFAGCLVGRRASRKSNNPQGGEADRGAAMRKGLLFFYLSLCLTALSAHGMSLGHQTKLIIHELGADTTLPMGYELLLSAFPHQYNALLAQAHVIESSRWREI